MMEQQNATVAYRFVVKEADGVICIVLEPQGSNLTILESGSLGLDMRLGTTVEDAERFARELNRLVRGVTYRED